MTEDLPGSCQDSAGSLLVLIRILNDLFEDPLNLFRLLLYWMLRFLCKLLVIVFRIIEQNDLYDLMDSTK